MGVLADLRARAAAALEPDVGDDWEVHALPVDAIVPPAFMLVWSEPWMVSTTHCVWSARLDIMAVANRVDLEPGVEILETLVETATVRLGAAGLPVTTVAQPRGYEHGGYVYLSSRLTLTQPLAL